jgi:folate-binding protein YgfZ
MAYIGKLEIVSDFRATIMMLKALLEQLGSTDAWGDYIPNESAQPAKNTPENHTKTCWLNQFTALKVDGPDAERFLQGQLTCNVNEITSGTVHLGACCNAKGRVVANFVISFDGENYWLVLPTSSAESLQKHLKKYKVFFKANIENCDESHLILGQWSENNDSGKSIKGQANYNAENQQHTLQITDQRRLVIINNNDNPDITLSNTLDNISGLENSLTKTLFWRLDDINDGIYYVVDDQIEEWVPQHINWHHLNGVSFSKGCYTGQEIIARLQYLGKAKKALYHYQGDAFDKSLVNQPMFNTEGKSMGKILFCRTHESQLHVLVVLNTDAPDSVMYITNTQEHELNKVDLHIPGIDS